MSSQYAVLRSLLSDRPIAFHPLLARALGGINEALFFQQIAYWSDKGDDPDWIFKTQAELEAETTLSRYQQEQARKSLKRLRVLSEQKRGLPAKLYYRVEWDALFALLNERSQQPRMRETRRQGWESPTSLETDDQGSEEPADQDAGNPQPLIGTKSTDKEYDRDPSNYSIGPDVLLAREDAERIAFLIRDVGREFVDQAPAKSSATRACRLYASSGLTLDEFFDVTQAARIRTKRFQGGVKSEPVERGGMMVRPKMAYYFQVLESMLGGEEMSSTAS